MSDPSVQRKKIKALVVIAILLGLIYAKNHIERQNFKEMGRAFNEVYEDRLVVNGYIFTISEGLFKIQELVDHCDIDNDYSEAIQEINSEEEKILAIIADFEQTKLTPEESVLLADFKSIIENDLRIENYELLFSDSAGVNVDQVKLYDSRISRAHDDLDKLSKIQVSEGEIVTRRSKKLLNRSQIWAQFEVALLLVLMVVMYLLVFRDSKRNKGVIS
ncbi:MCP four helix bundle domain-containing protein [Algoriphagus sediminis]|uniref:MCP four helix bundle domain-containing protein n=1 Tax=Algoriphagus sediminis TaxID=3057113 RepID=A0ABT7YI66_9BACT|nr:MCP four helix bundle domain-containing protein [Algoriphagus sediminis]MDN3205844.1 MCP four helix bundle domain-containing protein [Algoriphagus sediminis]